MLGKDEHFAITCDDKTVRLWDVRTGKQHRKFVGHQDYVFACSVHPTSTLFCSGSFDETIKLWDPRVSGGVSEIKAHAEPITGVQFAQAMMGHVIARMTMVLRDCGTRLPDHVWSRSTPSRPVYLPNRPPSLV